MRVKTSDNFTSNRPKSMLVTVYTIFGRFDVELMIYIIYYIEYEYTTFGVWLHIQLWILPLKLFLGNFELFLFKLFTESI